MWLIFFTLLEMELCKHRNVQCVTFFGPVVPGNTSYEMSLCTEIWKNTMPENPANIRFLMPKGAGDPFFVFLSVKSDWQLSSNPVKDLQLLIFCRGNTQEQKQLGVTARVLFLSLNVSREKQKKNSLLCKGDFFFSLPSQTVLFLWLFF